MIIPPHDYEMTVNVHDGEWVTVKYGNTTRMFDLVEKKSMGYSKEGTQPPSEPPKVKMARMNADDLAQLYADVHRIVYGDDTP